MTAGDSKASRLDQATEVIRLEAAALDLLTQRLREGGIDGFDAVVEAALACEGQLVITGMGKAGLVGSKISATLASTGTPSFFLHPGEALHGDLGRLRKGDILLALSNSGETEEVNATVPAARRLGVQVFAMTGRPD